GVQTCALPISPRVERGQAGICRRVGRVLCDGLFVIRLCLRRGSWAVVQKVRSAEKVSLVGFRVDAAGGRESRLLLRRKPDSSPGSDVPRHLRLHGNDIPRLELVDRKSTRLNSSHVSISYAVFCLKKKNNSDHHVN